MDWSVSRKEKRWQPKDGTAVMVLVDDVFDLYPVFGNEYAPTQITDVECLFDEKEELLDRSLFAVVKQWGIDPVEPSDGIQWAQAINGEVPAPLILVQVRQAVQREGPGVKVEPVITPRGTTFTVSLVT